MAGPDKKDREPWSPQIKSTPNFINSADYEDGLGESGNTPDIDVANEGSEEIEDEEAPAAPNPFIKPAGEKR
jgi:hypothetical protein